MKERLGWLLICAVIVATVFVIVLESPETFSASSSDHRAKIEGSVSSGARPSLVLRSDLAGPSGLRIGVYELQPVGTRFPAPLTLTIEVSQADLLKPLTIMEQDPSVGAWRPVSTTLDPSVPAVSAAVGEGGLWTVGHVAAVPDTATLRLMLADLLAGQPAGAVGYQADALVSENGVDYVLSRAGFSVGGCGGVYATGTSTRAVSVDRDIDGVSARLRLVWQLADGCAEGAAMRETR